MRINHNITALNTYRQLSSNGTQSSKNLEKLSSGLRINRAGDDAAGLAISEKMRGQIRGLDQATRNSQDAISMMQTAEGALNETHSILQRMKELATQAANDTYNSNDRTEIQKEINQLTSEINRIGNTTEFNTRKLLNGEISAESGVVTAGTLTAGTTTLSNLTLDKKSELTAGNYSIAVADTTTNTASATHTATADITNVSISASSALAAGDYQITIDETQVKTVAPTTTLDDALTSVSINPLSSVANGAHNVEVTRTEATANFTPAGGVNSVDYTSTSAAGLASGTYTIETTKALSNELQGTLGAVQTDYVSSLTVGDTTSINGDDIRLQFDQVTVDNKATITAGAAYDTAATLAVNAATSVNITIDGTAYNMDQAALQGLFDGAVTDGDVTTSIGAAVSGGAVALSTVADVTIENGSIVITSKTTGATSDVTFGITDGAADTANIQAAFGITAGTTDTGDSTTAFTATLRDNTGVAISDSIVLDNSQQTYTFNAAGGGAALDVTLQTVAGVNTALAAGAEDGKYMQFDVDTVLDIQDSTNTSVIGGPQTIAAGTVANAAYAAGDFTLDLDAQSALTAGSKTFDITNTFTATFDGADSQTFAAGGVISFANGVSVQTEADETLYSATAPETTSVTIGQDAAYTAVVETDLGGAVAGSQTVSVNGTTGGTYNLGNGVEFTLAAGATLTGGVDHDFSVAVATNTTTAATLTNTTTSTTVGTADVTGGATTADFGNGLTVDIAAATAGTATFAISGAVEDNSLTMQVGANQGQGFKVSVSDMRAEALGISSSDTGAALGAVGAAWTSADDVSNGTDNTGNEYGLDVSDTTKASAAIKVYDDAINAVSSERSRLGAFQNRLEHTINNLGTSSENLTAAESRIRDVDMAREMMEFTKNNILTQAAQSMLAQANQQPQGVLQLLR